MGVPVEGCWFCLGSSSVDISLVASVGQEAYVTLDKVGSWEWYNNSGKALPLYLLKVI